MIQADVEHGGTLPSAIYDLAMRLGARPIANVPRVSLKQQGRMRTSLGSTHWISFTATQTISTRTCAFDWLARMGPLGMISARDALSDGVGSLDVKALGFIPLARTKHTPALVRGELMRYLAELAWAPDAILHNPQLRWRVEGPDTLSVSAGKGETASEVILSLDHEGRIASAFAADRPRSATPPILPTPWRGRFSDYRQHGAVWLPFAGEVAWDIERKETVYWQGRLVDWIAEANPPSPGLRLSTIA
jgi:hypothetical protein